MKQLTYTDGVCATTGTIPAFGKAGQSIFMINETVVGPLDGTNHSAEFAKIFQEKFRYEENFIS